MSRNQPTTGDESGTSAPTKRIAKVAKFRVLKPAGGMKWQELGKLLKDVRYRVFRLANLAVSEAYLGFHLFRTGKEDEYKVEKPGALNARLRRMLIEEGTTEEEMNRFARKGALADTVCGALFHYKVRALLAKSKWAEVIRGKASLPTFRLDISIPIRCDKEGQPRLVRLENGDVAVDLALCLKPYPRVVLETGSLSGGMRATLDRLLENQSQSMEGYRQRCFEVKQNSDDGKWYLFVTYDFPATGTPGLSTERVVGVDLGVTVPLYAAISNGHARLGRREFAAIAARIRSLQRQTFARRRSMLTGGRSSLASETARAGHGRKRRLQPIKQLEGRIDNAYTTLNHQLSASVVRFALDHGAGVIQIEDLEGLKEVLRGTFLGGRWRYHQLQQFIEYKAGEKGIEVRKVNPRYTSRRCSKCGWIHAEFDRATRDAAGSGGMVARFECPREECGYKADPDYNAARNLATLDIAAIIEQQCKVQGIAL